MREKCRALEMVGSLGEVPGFDLIHQGDSFPYNARNDRIERAVVVNDAFEMSHYLWIRRYLKRLAQLVLLTFV